MNKRNHISLFTTNILFAWLLLFGVSLQAAKVGKVQIAEVVQAIGQSPETALSLAQALYAKDSTGKQIVYLLAKAYSVNGDNGMSDFYNERLLQKDSLYLPSLVLKAEHLLTANDIQSAKRIIETINEHFPQSASAHYLNARYALTQNALEEAKTEALSALQTDASISDAHLVLANVAMRKADYTEAIAEYEQAKLLFSHSAEQLNNYGVCLLESGKYAEAVSILQRANGLSKSTKLAYNLGLALYQNKQYAEARQQFALQNDSLNWYFIAKSYEAENQLDSAIIAYEKFTSTGKRHIWLLKSALFISRNWYYLLAALICLAVLFVSLRKRK